jgi:hypothetical protein
VEGKRLMKKKKKKNNLRILDNFFQNKFLIDQKVMDHVRKTGGILHGGKATNIHLPPHLDKHTEDFDVYTKKPKVSARKLEKALDKMVKADLFKTIEAKHKGTYKVVNKETGKTIADFTKPKSKIPHEIEFGGVNVAKLKYIKEKLKRIISDPSKEFRHDKDKETLKRIKIYEKLYRKLGGKQ